ncbi:MAG: cardiolipin synthase [Woeseiaceae bacterium]
MRLVANPAKVSVRNAWNSAHTPMTIAKIPELFTQSICVLTLCFIAACASEPQPDSDFPLEDYPVLPGRFAEQGVLTPLVTSEAFIGDDEFFISFDGVDGRVFAGGNWSDRMDIAAVEANTDGTYGGPYILPLDYQQREPWSDRPETQIAPRLLTSQQWGSFREGLFASVLPRTANVGVVMHFNNDDYFLYYNDVDRFEARLFRDKPQDYSVSESISFADFIRRGLPHLELFLAQEGIEDRRIVFDTGDVGAYSLPFLYVDLDLPIAVFVRYAPAPKGTGSSASGAQVAQSVGHVAQSHLGGLVVRPVSSVFRLFFVVTGAAVETVRPTWLVTLESQPVPEVSDSSPMNIDEWERQLDSIMGRAASKGTIDFLIDGEQYFTRLIDSITSAQKSILIRTYIFDNDDVAEGIGRLLRRRAEEGVEVKILLDGFGTIVATGAEHESIPEDYVAPESVRRFLEENSEIEVRQAKNPWLVAGDHVKTTIIDDEFAFTGGMNIGREYRYVWHDMMMEVRGPVVDIIRQDFRDAWSHAGLLGDVGYFFHKMRRNREFADDIGYPVRALFTRPGNAEIFRAQIAAIRNARKQIYIQNAYFTDDAMLYELARARRRGVDVRVIMPLVGNHGPVNRSNVLAVNAMLEHGIRVYLYPGMSHIKAAVFDGWACLGSANWDKLSFRTNKELNLATSHPQAVDELMSRVFKVDIENSVEILEPFPERWSDRLAEVVADFLL